MFVVANTDTLQLLLWILSIYLRNSHFTLLSVSDSPVDLFLPSESISSIKIIEGYSSRASSNRVINNFSLSPINLEVMSDTLTQKHLASECWATAYVNIVLPTPGGPYKSILCHGLTPSLNSSGWD